MGLEPPSQFRSGAICLDRSLRMVLLGYADLLQLDRYRSPCLSDSLPGIYMVYGAHLRKEVPRIQRVSAKGGQVLTIPWRWPR